MRRARTALFLVCLLLAGCRAAPLPRALPTPFQPLMPTATPTSAPFTPTPEARLWVDPMLPAALREAVQAAGPVKTAGRSEDANLHLGVTFTPKRAAEWVYVLAAPFSSLDDGVDSEALRAFWSGKEAPGMPEEALLMSAETLAAFEARWGRAAAGAVEVVRAENLLKTAWGQPQHWALIPFEALEPRWKVLRVDGASPLDRDFQAKSYPLTVYYGVVEGDPAGWVQLPATNRDSQRLTVVVMSGVTALVRSTGAKMESLGMRYPGEEIKDWLRDADFTHVSNEVSFDPRCPPANPHQTSLMFCSRPEYLDLLSYVGVDIVELTGNHVMDYEVGSLPYSLEQYRQRNMRYYAAGMNQAEAREPLLLEHNGNKIAFVGCNPAGPPTVWATETRPGVANCDDDWMTAKIRELRDKGYLVIATVQYFEHYAMTITPFQQRDFPPLAEAGAVIVQGSQAHYPQGFGFVGSSLIHYGLGNLFFDQMYVPEGFGGQSFHPDLPIPGTRLEFIDRHVFYDGRYVGSEILTAVLEDYAQPRPMSAAERRVFLQEAFRISLWPFGEENQP